MTRPCTSSPWRPSCPGCIRRPCAPTTGSAWCRQAGPRAGGRRYSLRDILVLREVQRLSQEEGVNLSGIKRILELETKEQRSRGLLAEMHAEITQLRAELESTRAVAARLAGLLRSRNQGATLVPGPPLRRVRDRPAGTRGSSRREPGRGRRPGAHGRAAGDKRWHEKLTHKSQEALSDAVGRPPRPGNPNVDGLHLLAALIGQDGGTAVPLLQAVGADPATVLKADQRSAGQAAPGVRRPR